LSGPDTRMAKRAWVHAGQGASLHAEIHEAPGLAVLLLHGGGDGAFAWDFTAPALATQFTTIAVDLRGHGNSSRDPSGRYELSTHIADVRALVDLLNLSQFAIIGHSLGAQLAIHICAEYAERICAAVLVDFAPATNAGGIRRMRNLLRAGLRPYKSVDEYVAWLQQTRPLLAPGRLTHIATRALRRESHVFRLKIDPALASSVSNTHPDERDKLWSMLRTQHCPTLLVRGTGSAVLSHFAANQVLETLPDGALATVDWAGHSVMLDNPESFANTTLGFLNRVLVNTEPSG
jgi:pimeloyl-ACP methyl ester carboxylesterase